MTCRATSPSPAGVAQQEGHPYPALVAWFGFSSQDRAWISVDVMAFDNGIVGQEPPQCWSAGNQPMREQLWGKEEAGVRVALKAARPDPLAARYSDLDPGQRYQRVASDRG